MKMDEYGNEIEEENEHEDEHEHEHEHEHEAAIFGVGSHALPPAVSHFASHISHFAFRLLYIWDL